MVNVISNLQDILLNHQVLAVNQDPLAVPVRLVHTARSMDSNKRYFQDRSGIKLAMRPCNTSDSGQIFNMVADNQGVLRIQSDSTLCATVLADRWPWYVLLLPRLL